MSYNNNYNNYTYNDPQQQQQYGYPQQQQQYGGQFSYPQQQQNVNYNPNFNYTSQQQVAPPSYDDTFKSTTTSNTFTVPMGTSGSNVDGGWYSASNQRGTGSIRSVGGDSVRTFATTSTVTSASTVIDSDAFGDKAIRRGFLQKVYAILMCQLLVTGGIMAAIMFIKPIRLYVQEEYWVMIAAMVGTFACIIVLACVPGFSRKTPGNFICLGIFTVLESIMLGTTASYFNVDAVLMAVGATAAISLGLSIFAFQTKIDFTTCGALIICLLMILLFYGLFFIWYDPDGYAQIGYSAIGAVVMSFIIVYDTQIMIGGKHKYSISPEEYIFAALNLYVDIIRLFLYILAIVGKSNND